MLFDCCRSCFLVQAQCMHAAYMQQRDVSGAVWLAKCCLLTSYSSCCCRQIRASPSSRFLASITSLACSSSSSRSSRSNSSCPLLPSQQVHKAYCVDKECRLMRFSCSCVGVQPRPDWPVLPSLISLPPLRARHLLACMVATAAPTLKLHTLMEPQPLIPLSAACDVH